MEGYPVYNIESGPPPPAQPRFTCKLTIPATGIIPQKEFVAANRTKKGAEHDASQLAVDYISSYPTCEKGLNASKQTTNCGPVVTSIETANDSAKVSPMTASNNMINDDVLNDNMSDDEVISCINRFDPHILRKMVFVSHNEIRNLKSHVANLELKILNAKRALDIPP